MAVLLIFVRYATGIPQLIFSVDLLLATISFLMTWVLLRGLDKPREALAKAYQNQLKRAYPGLVALVVVVTLAVKVFGSPYLFKDTFLTGVSALFGAANELAYRLDDLPMGGPEETNALYQLWAVSLLMQFIVIYPWIITWLAQITRSNLWVTLIATIAMWGVIAYQMPASWDGANYPYMLYSFQTRSLSLFTGAAVAVIRFMYEQHQLNKHIAKQEGSKTGPRRRDIHGNDPLAARVDVQRSRMAGPRVRPYVLWTAVGIASIVAFAATSMEFKVFYDAWMYQGGFVLVNLAIGFMMWSLTSRWNLLVRFFGFSAFSALGQAAFPLFLLIFPVLWFTRLILPVDPTSWVVNAIAGAVLLALGGVSHLFLLTPGREVKWKIATLVPLVALLIVYILVMAEPFLNQVLQMAN